MHKLVLFFAAAFLVTVFAFTPARAEDGGEAVSTSELSPRFYDAGVELESTSKWRDQDSRGFDTDATLVLGWTPREALRLGLETTGTLAREANGGGLGNTELSILRKGISLGGFGAIDAGSLSVLPTKKEERNAGLVAATGALVGWEMETFPGLKVGYEAIGLRYFRSDERASKLSEGETPVPAAAAFDKYSLEQTLGASYELFRGVSMEASGTHTSMWKWFEGREAELELEQKFVYETGPWKVSVGHRNKTLVLAASGDRLPITFSSAKDSTVFGALAWTL